MEAQQFQINPVEFRQLVEDVAYIKQAVAPIHQCSCHEMEEVELTDWAKKELAEARASDRSEYISLDDLEKEILEK